MECHRLCIQRIVVNARRSLVAAAMRRRHLHLAALAFHHPAAGTFFECSSAHSGTMQAIAGARHDTSSRTSTANWRQCLTQPIIPLKFPVSIDAGESRFGPAIFTDSLSERSRWIENPSFASSWRITVYSELTGRLTTRNRLIPSGEIPAGKSASVYQSSRFHLDESPPIRSPDPWPVSIAPGRFDHDSSQVCVT